MTWITDHWMLITSILTMILSSVANAMTEYPKIETWLHFVLDILSVVPKAGSANALPVKLPLVGVLMHGAIGRSQPPTSNHKAYAPNSTSKTVFMLVAFPGIAIPGIAHAELPIWSQGPTVSFLRFGFNHQDKPEVHLLNAGAGWTLRYNPRATLSTDGLVCNLSLDATALADFSSLPTGGSLAIAAGPSTYNGLIGLQVGYKLFEIIDGMPTDGLFTLSGGKRNVFFLINVSVNMLFGGGGTHLMGASPAYPNYFSL